MCSKKMEERNLTREKNSKLSCQFMVWFGFTPGRNKQVGMTDPHEVVVGILDLVTCI